MQIKDITIRPEGTKHYHYIHATSDTGEKDLTMTDSMQRGPGELGESTYSCRGTTASTQWGSECGPFPHRAPQLEDDSYFPVSIINGGKILVLAMYYYMYTN